MSNEPQPARPASPMPQITPGTQFTPQAQRNPQSDMMAAVGPVVAKFSEYPEGKITKAEAKDLFIEFMKVTLPKQLQPTRDLATSLVKAPMNGFAQIPQIMAAMVTLLQD